MSRLGGFLTRLLALKSFGGCIRIVFSHTGEPASKTVNNSLHIPPHWPLSSFGSLSPASFATIPHFFDTWLLLLPADKI